MRFLNVLFAILVIALLVPGCTVLSSGAAMPLFLVGAGLFGLWTNHLSGREVRASQATLQQGEYEADCTDWDQLLAEFKDVVSAEAEMEYQERMAFVREEETKRERVRSWLKQQEQKRALIEAFDGVMVRNNRGIAAYQEHARVQKEEKEFVKEMKEMGFKGPFKGILSLDVVWAAKAVR